MKKNYIIITIIILVIISGSIFLIFRKKDNNEETFKMPVRTGDNINFDFKIIKKANEHYKDNYLISPMSIAYAMSMLNDGASDTTKEEITKLLGNYKTPNIINIKDRINIANALFIKNEFKSQMNDSYVTYIKSNYNADTIYDDFVSPDKLNAWVKEKTYNMIPKLVDTIDPNFVLGIVNALAIDIEWKNKFECERTTKADFNLKDNTKMDTAYMHSSDDVLYFEIPGAKGIIKDYESYNSETGKSDYSYENNSKNIELEYIAILPDNIDNFINSFDEKTLTNIKNSTDSFKESKINLSLPKYTYDFNYDDFKDDLISLGMKEAFDKEKASFKNITDKNNIYVDKALHKTHIELSESGTKAAAVTAFMMNYKSSIDRREIINIEFNKPFIYIIKDKNSDNIWFFGTVYTPIKWENNKCETKRMGNYE